MDVKKETAHIINQVKDEQDIKTAVKLFKTQHALHVLLIMQLTHCTKSQAEIAAWAEGQLGYNQRMSGAK